MRDDLDQTMYFDKNMQQELGPREVLRQVYTSYNNARALIKKYDRDQYIEEMLINYLDER